MPHVSRNRGSNNSPSRDGTYDPSEEGYDSDQADEIRAWEEGQKRFFEELAEED